MSMEATATMLASALVAGLLFTGCAGKTPEPGAPSEVQADLVDVSLNSFTGRYSFRPIQRRNSAQASTSRKSSRPR